MVRILGSTGTRRRRRYQLGALASLVALLALFAVPNALAVHDVSVFQLDGDAQKAAGDTQHLEDWDVICKSNPSTCTFQDALGAGVPTTTATTSSHVGDGALNASIFTGGGSKDPQDISDWAWKDGGGLPDKDNLLHAYAARYVVDASTTCPNGSDPITGKCTLLYFGADRFANDGDAQMGFWFLQNRVTTAGVKLGGGTSFTGVHKAGDLLVISDFSNGGTTSTINVFKWVESGGDAGTHLLFLAGSDAANCGNTALPSPDRFCGIVNAANGTIAPWEFTGKGGNSTFDQGELYEAGINLSDPTINLGGECFSSFVAETRSSTSPTAVLKDFVLGQFAICAPGMTTQASETVSSPVLPGHAVHDTATITVSGATNPADPTGDVTFYLCGPIAAGDCGTAGGTLIGTGTLSGGANTTDGIASAISPDVNTSTNKLAPGRYCFRATWPGDSTYVLAQPLNVTNSDTECFAVKDTSSMTTHQIWLPNDEATVTSTGGTALSGTVKFELYSGNNCGATSGTKLWPTVTDPPGTGEFTLSSATSPATVGPTTNTAVTVEADATVSWKVTFTSTDVGVDSPASPTCEVSTLDLTPNQ